jgi:hypothetical protein
MSDIAEREELEEVPVDVEVPDNDNGAAEDEEDSTEQEPEGVELAVLRMLPEIRSRETTMETFIRLTDSQPHIPFHSANPSRPKTDIDEHEETLFLAMENQYDRWKLPRQPHGYHSFMVAWNLKVAERYKLKAVDGLNVTMINRKNIEYLQNHYDKIMGQLASAGRIDHQNANNELDRLNEQLRASRNSVPALQPVQQAQPVIYPQVGIAPFGNAYALNPEILAPTLQAAKNRNPAPWNIRAPLLATAEKHPLEGFKRTTWCISCGFQKREHQREESFGAKCKRDHCGKCFMRKEFHNDGRMGPFCPFDPDPIKSRYLLWY